MYNKEYWERKGLRSISYRDIFLPMSWIYEYGHINLGIVLDFGCGIGKTIDTLIKMDVDTYGYEPSKWAREHPFRYAKGRLFNEIPNIPFDLIYSLDVFEHIHDEELRLILSKLTKLSKLFIFEITPCDHKNYKGDITHINPKTIPEWREFLKPHFDKIVDTPECFYVKEHIIVCKNDI